MSPVDAHATARMPRAVGDHLLDDRDQHRHAEVLERPGVRVAAQLDPEIVEAELAAVALGPEQVRAALVHRDDVLVAHLGADPLLLAPDAGAVRPAPCACSARRTAASTPAGLRCRQRVEVVHDLQQVAARAGSGRSAARWSDRRRSPAVQRKTARYRAMRRQVVAAAAAAPNAASKSASDRPMRIGSTPWPCSTSTVL